MIELFTCDGVHSTVLRTLPLTESLNKRINDSTTFVQSLLPKPSFTRRTFPALKTEMHGKKLAKLATIKSFANFYVYLYYDGKKAANIMYKVWLAKC